MTKDNHKKQQALHYLKENIRFIFSFKGVVNRWQFALFLIFVNAIFFQDLLFLSYVMNLISFYCILALVQKRCRDFNSSGTFWIILISLAFVVGNACHFIGTNATKKLLPEIYKYSFNFQFIVFLPLFFIPSKPEPDMELRSPLLKYPLLYTVICGVLSVAVIWAVSFYADVDVNIL